MFSVREDSDLCLQKWPVRGVASSPPFDLVIRRQINGMEVLHFVSLFLKTINSRHISDQEII